MLKNKNSYNAQKKIPTMLKNKNYYNAQRWICQHHTGAKKGGPIPHTILHYYAFKR